MVFFEKTTWLVVRESALFLADEASRRLSATQLNFFPSCMGNMKSLGDDAKLTSEVAAFRVIVEAKDLGANNKVRQAEFS